MILFIFVVFAISSGFLYSNLFIELRNYIISFENNKYYLLRKSSSLGICQLCISVWIGLAIEWLFIDTYSIVDYISLALAVASISWMLGAITNGFLWHKALCEDLVTKNGKY